MTKDQERMYRFFLGGLPESSENGQSNTPTLTMDGLSMDERWAKDPLRYAEYMSRKLAMLNKLA